MNVHPLAEPLDRETHRTFLKAYRDLYLAEESLYQRLEGLLYCLGSEAPRCGASKPFRVLQHWVKRLQATHRFYQAGVETLLEHSAFFCRKRWQLWEGYLLLYDEQQCQHFLKKALSKVSPMVHQLSWHSDENLLAGSLIYALKRTFERLEQEQRAHQRLVGFWEVCLLNQISLKKPKKTFFFKRVLRQEWFRLGLLHCKRVLKPTDKP